MAFNIGFFKTTDTGYTRKIETLALKTQAVFHRVLDRTHQNAPAFEIFAGDLRIGAAWERQGTRGKYLSVSFEDPSFSSGYYKEHCLPFFIDPKCPATSIRDDNERIDLNGYFRETFASKATNHNFKVGDIAFRLTGLRLYNPHEIQHRLLYAANFREVIAEKLEKYL